MCKNYNSSLRWSIAIVHARKYAKNPQTNNKYCQKVRFRNVWHSKNSGILNLSLGLILETQNQTTQIKGKNKVDFVN